jgi:hypothetical protein
MPIFDVEAAGKSFEIEAPDFTTAVAALKTHLSPSQPEADNSFSGSASALGIGGIKGIVGLAGLPADALDLATRGIDYAAGTKTNEAVGKPAADYAGFGALQGYLEKVTGPLYEPKTGLESTLQTVGEFAPGGLVGAGRGIARRAATQVLAPALASEGAGALTKGTEAEPYARLAGAIGGAAGATKLAHMSDARKTASAVPAAVDLETATKAGYNHPEVQALRINSQGAGRFVDDVVSDLKKNRFSEKQAGKTYDALDNLRAPEFATSHTIQDFDATRRLLQKIAIDAGPEGEAARRAVRAIDAYTLRVPTADVVAGDARAAGKALFEGRANAAAGFRNERIQQIVERAQNTAGATHSGGNLENELRKGVRSLLNSKGGLRGFSQEERLALTAFARGSVSSNIMRRVAKVFGGGGGLGQLMSGGAGAALAGPVGMVALPALGIAANKASSALALDKLQKIAGQVRGRSPAGAAIAPPVPVSQLSTSKNALLSAILARPSLPLQQPLGNYQGR